MVGGISSEEREQFMRRLKAGVVLLVGFSAGLITLYGDAGPAGIAAATAVGLGVGYGLVWLTFPTREDVRRGDPERSRRRRP